MNRSVNQHILLTAVAFYLCSTLIFSQDDFYYSIGETIPLTISEEKISIRFRSGITESQIHQFLQSETVLGDLEPLRPAVARGFFTIALKGQTDVKQLVKRLKGQPDVDIINPVYLIRGKLEAIPFDHFIVKFDSSVTRAQIDKLNKEHHVQIVRVSTASLNKYTLRITSESNLSVLEISKLYYETLPAEWALPDFISPGELLSIPPDPPNDTYFDRQYYLHNTGQTGGVNDADIDALQAWGITTGDPSIIVAVIDEGVEAHPDLPSSRLEIIDKSDFYDNDDEPIPEGNEAHGMAVAGIIAATQNNNLGISGVAPNVKIMPIRIFNWEGRMTSTGNVADAIDFAWVHGAHVISNNWGYPFYDDPNLYPDFKVITE